MKINYIVTFLACVIFPALVLQAKEPQEPATMPIKPGVYLLIKQAQINDQMLSLAELETITVRRSGDGQLTVHGDKVRDAVIQQEGDIFTFIRTTPGESTHWVETYVGSFKHTSDPIAYHGNYVSIAQSTKYAAFGRGTFFMVYQKEEPTGQPKHAEGQRAK